MIEKNKTKVAIDQNFATHALPSKGSTQSLFVGADQNAVKSTVESAKNELLGLS